MYSLSNFRNYLGFLQSLFCFQQTSDALIYAKGQLFCSLMRYIYTKKIHTYFLKHIDFKNYFKIMLLLFNPIVCIISYTLKISFCNQ